MWFNTFCMPSHCASGSWEPSFCAASVEGTGVVLGLLSRFLKTIIATQLSVCALAMRLCESNCYNLQAETDVKRFRRAPGVEVKLPSPCLAKTTLALRPAEPLSCRCRPPPQVDPTLLDAVISIHLKRHLCCGCVYKSSLETANLNL